MLMRLTIVVDVVGASHYPGHEKIKDKVANGLDALDWGTEPQFRTHVRMDDVDRTAEGDEQDMSGVVGTVFHRLDAHEKTLDRHEALLERLSPLATLLEAKE